MRPADEIERLLTGLRDRTSASFDERTLSAMFSALDSNLSGIPARPWRDTGRAIMQSRITKLAAAAVLALAVLLLARHLTGGETPAVPGDKSVPVAKMPDNRQVLAPVSAEPQQKAQRLAQELDNAREFFAAGDAKGLLGLLDTGLDQTKVTVAGYLGQMKEESAVPALQWLADRWQGPADDNPFRKSIEQIRSGASQQQGIGGESRAEKRVPAAARRDCTITVVVCRRASGAPVPNAEIQTFVQGDTENRTHTADEKGAFVLDLAGLTPEYVRITVRAGGYVAQEVELWAVREQNLPRTVRFSLEEGTVIGGVVQDRAGRPVDGASVRLLGYVGQPQKSELAHPIVSVRLMTDDQGRWRSDSVPARIETDLWLCVEHPEFADAQFSMPRELTLEDLRAERAIVVLDEGATIIGHVTDTAGAPIAGAEVGTRQINGDTWKKTDAVGHFSFSHVSPFNQAFFLTVQARGYTPQERELSSGTDLSAVEFILEPAAVLVGRVVDIAGPPVEGASVTASRWKDNSMLKWTDKTDANGLFAWDYAPAESVEIRIHKDGYRDSTEYLMRNAAGDGQQQTFVLARLVTIQGTVTDSRTGEPIPRFKVTPRWRGGNLYATPEALESLAKWFTDGYYSYAFHQGGQANAVRIEADGYLPQESRFVDANERVATIDIALTQGEGERGPSGYVFDANAAPVAGAQVIWGRNNVQIYNGRAAVDGRAHVHMATDDNGHFAFAAADRQDPFLAVSDRGIGGASYEEFARDGFITLNPWARVEGQWRIGSRPAANQELSLWLWHDQVLPQAGMDAMKAATDENGRFVFEKVYPGKFTLYNEIFWATPGRTLNVVVGGEGRIVRGELTVPSSPDTAIRAGLTVVPATVPVPFEKIPKPPGYERMSFDEVHAWLERFSDSPEGKAYSKWLSQTDARSFQHLRVDMDDPCRFHVDNVEPGVYILRGEVKSGGFYDGRAMAVAPGQEHLLSKLIGSVWHEFEVPPLASDAELDLPLDLGALSVRPATTPRPGDPAPDFDLPTFGEGRIRLADCRGKVVLVTFFMADCLKTYPQGLEELKTVYEHFHEDARYAQIGLFFESYPLLAKKAADEAQLSWPLGLIWEHSGRETREYALPSKMLWNVVIDAQGRIFARDLSGEALESAIDAALQTVR